MSSFNSLILKFIIYHFYYIIKVGIRHEKTKELINYFEKFFIENQHVSTTN